MSRLIVKNLPKKITEAKLQETFSSQGGCVTDVQLKYSKDGVFRHFGFVGFKTEEDAEKARIYFNNTFIGATKVKVEVCADIGDAKKPKAWSKHAAENQVRKEEKKIHQSEKESAEDDEVKDLFVKYKDDPKFQEFLRIHKRNWADDWNNRAILEVSKSFEGSQRKSEQEEEVETKEEEEKESSDEEEEDVAKSGAVSDLDYIKAKMVDAPKEAEKKKKKEKEPKKEVYFTIKISNLPFNVKKKHIKDFFKPQKLKSIRIPRSIKGIAYVGLADEKEGKKALNKNKSILEGRQVLVKHYRDPNEEKNSNGTSQWENVQPAEESVGESGRIFVRNLTYTVSEEELRELFQKFGPLTEVNLPVDRQTRKIKGFAFITYMMPENAAQAFEALDGTTYQGRLLHLIPGKGKPNYEEEQNGSEGGSTFKQKKSQKEKSQAGSSHNWNTLFLGTSAVADIMSETYNVSKSDVLTGDGKQSAAVRLALGETQIVNETRQFLESEGIHIDAFSRPPKERSQCVILVKNLPLHTSVEEIRDTFAKHGELGRVVLPPRGITAIVEFLEPSEAKKAFRSLAYTKFKNTPLYLEWAPKDSFSGERPEPAKIASQQLKSDGATNKNNTTLFVKNLNFSTTEESLRNHFSSAGEVVSATISKKKDMKRPGEMLSMGYGFVNFATVQAADKALKELQTKMLDFHCLELKRSNRAPDAETSNASKRKNVQTEEMNTKESTKILVRNIPFEADAREVEDIFKTFGLLKSVRLPKKVTGSHRGFAFVDFGSVEEAKKAFDSLCHSTHLYGRRLVLEWASEEETIEDLRKKAANQFAHSGTPAKKQKNSKMVESLAMTAPSK